jgi:hypothetical protein
MLNTINLEDNANPHALHTLSANELDLVAGGFNWNDAAAGAAAGFGVGILIIAVLI